MGKHYVSCERCDKDLVIKTSNDYYFSDIDGKVLCKECWEKEQPKELAKQISDLQSQLAEKDKEIERLKELVAHKTYNRNALEARLNYEQNQKAIERLEKVKNFVDGRTYLAHYIDQQINELKGEKNE